MGRAPDTPPSAGPARVPSAGAARVAKPNGHKDEGRDGYPAGAAPGTAANGAGGSADAAQAMQYDGGGHAKYSDNRQAADDATPMCENEDAEVVAAAVGPPPPVANVNLQGPPRGRPPKGATWVPGQGYTRNIPPAAAKEKPPKMDPSQQSQSKSLKTAPPPKRESPPFVPSDWAEPRQFRSRAPTGVPSYSSTGKPLYQTHGKELVGKRVTVYWSDTRKGYYGKGDWFTGTCCYFDNVSGWHIVKCVP